jgi:hypothetical protein
MLPYRKYFKALGFTEQGLEEMTRAQMLNQVDSVLLGFYRGGVLKVLERLFSDDEVYVDEKTTTTSPGFAGSGSGDNAFTGTYPDGTALPGGYTHYHRDTTANRVALAKAMRDKLKRWHPGPYDFVGSQAEVDAIAASADFVAAESDLILRAQGVAAARVPAERYVGVFDKDVRVWHGRLELGSSANFSVFKTYGDFDARNPLKWRYSERFGRGLNVRFRSLFPLDNAICRQRFGVGVGDRTAATLAAIAASGAYTEPTIA